MTPMTFQDLDAFVQQSDALGGPGSVACNAYWEPISYIPNVLVDEALDPFSDDYVNQQLAVYAELSGRPFNQAINEHSVIDVDTHIFAVNPYNHPSPGELALHLHRLSRALRQAAPLWVASYWTWAVVGGFRPSLPRIVAWMSQRSILILSSYGWLRHARAA